METQNDDGVIPGLLLGDLSSTDELVAAIVALPDPLHILRPVRSPEGELTELIFEYVNPAAVALMQVPVESVIGHANTELFPSVADPSIWSGFVEALDTGKPVSWVTPFDENGVKGAFRITATALLDGLLLLTTQDVTELTATQTRLRAVLDSLLDPHVQFEPVRDSAGTIIDFQIADANTAACLYMNFTYEEFIGKRLLTFVPGISKELLGMYVNVVETGEPLVLDDYFYEQERMSGEVRYYDLRLVKMNGGATHSWRDVTDRHEQHVKELERVAELERFQRLTVRRELKMIELKTEIEHLEQSGTPPPKTDLGDQY